MEEQKKKRQSRPSWAMVNELKAKLEEQIEGTSRLVKDCDAWREKYRALKEKYDQQLKADEHLSGQLDELKNNVKAAKAASYESVGHVRTLEQSNKIMEAELNKVRKELELERSVSDTLAAESERLKNRGFLARLFNKD